LKGMESWKRSEEEKKGSWDCNSVVECVLSTYTFGIQSPAQKQNKTNPKKTKSKNLILWAPRSLVICAFSYPLWILFLAVESLTIFPKEQTLP
jgi:hypothetical protein